MSRLAEISDRDLILVRLRFLDLLKSFFVEEPDAERMSRWRGIFAALTKERINRQLDDAIEKLAESLNKKDLQDLRDEYYALFTDPYSRQLLPLNAAYYLDGKSFGPSLVDYRELLKQARLIKDRSITEPEDSLPLMLDTLIALIEEEKQGGGEQTRELQTQLVEHFLIPTTVKLLTAVENNSKADFYCSCIEFLKAYLDLEKGLFESVDDLR
ncbi:MAG: molecular chaperone TorD family protein [Desulfobulbaceae bacterium]|nr:molecular chaperone TorD family protein [Desulfobulbaceae bacterium]